MRWWKKKKKQDLLLVMHHADMFYVHPETDWSHLCGRCGEVVGIFPSGQKFLQERPGLEIVCNRCHHPLSAGELLSVGGYVMSSRWFPFPRESRFRKPQ